MLLGGRRFSSEAFKSRIRKVLAVVFMLSAACTIIVASRVGLIDGEGFKWQSLLKRELDGEVDAYQMEGRCHTAERGEICYYDIMYAQKRYLKAHPDWYPGLNVESSFNDIQFFLHHQNNGSGQPRCPRPCDYVPRRTVGVRGNLTSQCHTARGGEDCYTHVMYTSKQIPEHPDWYLGLVVNSTFVEIQDYLSRQTSDAGPVCPRPCEHLLGRHHNKDSVKKPRVKCRTAIAGDKCYDAVRWVRNVGWKKHPKWFKNITGETSPEDVQTYLSKHKGSHCRYPACPCRDAIAGSECYSHVAFTMKEVPEHPNWYPGLTTKSSFKDVQAYLSEESTADGMRVCPMPCNLEGQGTHDANASGNVSAHCANSTKCINGSDDRRIGCHTTIAGEECFDQVLWAMKEVNIHPEWYAGLSNESSFQAFQELLHRGKHDSEGKLCPMPCSLAASHNISVVAAGDCHTTVQGEPCWDNVVKTHMEVLENAASHEGIPANFTFEDIQLKLSLGNTSRCDHKPCPCRTTTEGEECFRHVEWVRHTGLLRHPELFVGLTNESTVEEIQYRLHPLVKDHCLLPCVAPWVRLQA